MPTAFAMGALPLIWRSEGYSLAAIGVLSLLYLPWVLKALWAPWIDRASRTAASRTRFLAVAQGAVTLTSLTLAFLPPGALPQATFIAIFVLSIASATADNAGDALTIRLTPKDDSERVNGWREAAILAASALGAGGGFVIASNFGWTMAVGLLSLLTLSGLISTLLLRRATEDAHSGDRDRPLMRASLMSAFKRDNALLLFGMIVLASAANRMAGANPRVLLADLGLTAEAIGFITGLLEPAVTITAAACSGIAAKVIGVTSLLPAAIVAKSIALLLLAAAVFYDLSDLIIVVLLLTAAFCFALIAASMGALIMRWSRAGCEATDAAVFFTTAALVWLMLQPISGLLADKLGYSGLFLGVGLVMLPMAWAFSRMAKKIG